MKAYDKGFLSYKKNEFSLCCFDFYIKFKFFYRLIFAMDICKITKFLKITSKSVWIIINFHAKDAYFEFKFCSNDYLYIKFNI